MAFCLLLVFACGQVSAAEGEVWHRDFDLSSNPLGPLGGDFDYDGRNELILSDPSGRVRLVRASDGGELWSVDLETDVALAPVAGHFLDPSGPIQVAWLCRSGEVCVLSAPTGQVVCRAHLAAPEGEPSLAFAVAPSLLPSRGRGGTDALVAVSESRRLCKIVVIDASVVVNEWAEARIGSLSDMPLHPLAVGQWPSENQGDRSYGLAFLSVGRRLLVAFPDQRNRPPIEEQVWSIGDRQTCVSLTEGPGGHVRELLAPDDTGRVLRYRALPPSQRRLERIGEAPAGGTQRPGEPILIADVDGYGDEDWILTGRQDVRVMDGRTGRIMDNLGRYVSARPFSTPAAFFVAHNKKPYLVVGDDGRHIQAIDLLQMSRPETVLRLPAGQLLGTSPLVLDADDSGRAAIFVQSVDGGHLIQTEIPIRQGSTPWSEWSGSPLHSGGVPDLHRAERDAAYLERRSSLAQTAASARQALDRGDFQEALQLSEGVLRFNPRHRDARETRGRAMSTKHFIPHLIGTLAFALVALIIGVLIWRQWAIRKVIARARDMAEDGDEEGVFNALRRHLRFHHPSTRVVECMGDMCQRFDRLEEDWTPLFEKWHRNRPEIGSVSGILARLYLKQDRTDEGAAGVYELARRSSDDPAPFELALGKVYASHGHMQQARTHLEQAYRLGVREPEIFDTLARVYASLDQITPRNLPVFQRAAQDRPKDPEVLEWVVLAYVNARLQKDPRAQKAVRSLVSLRPDSEVANQELAVHAYREADYDEAEHRARKALDKNPENATALQVLAWTLWQRRDMGPEARDIYRRAQSHHPDDSLLLRIVAQVAMDDDTFTDTTALGLLKAVETNAHDAEFLAAAAHAGLRWKAMEIVAGALSRLARIEELDDRQALALAQAYLEIEEDDSAICPVMARAFSIEPQMPGLAEALGAIVVREDMVDARYEDVLHALHGREPENLRWAVQLARILQAQERYDAMAEALAPYENYQPESADAETSALHADMQRLLAEAHANLQEFAKAVDHYRSLLEAQPDDPDALVGLGSAYARMSDRSDEMYEVIDRAHQLSPEAPWLNFALGERAVEREQWKDASHAFQVALRAGDEFVELVMNRIGLLIKRMQGSRTMPARWLRVEALLALERYQDVLEETETVYALDNRELDRVSEVFEQILKFNPKSVFGLIGHGRCLHRRGRDVEARLVLEMALNHDPDNETAKRILVDIYESLLKGSEDSGVRFALGELAMALHDYDRAVPCFQKTRLDPRLENISTRRLAETFYHKKMYDLALQEFQNVPVDEETMPMLYQMGREFETRNNVHGARMAYQRIYATDARFQDVADRIHNLTQSSEVQITMGLGTLGPAQEKRDETADRYDLQEEIGRGAMASVYRAHDRELDEIVALKILPDNLLRNPEAVRRFRLEARSARRLTHENIVRIHDIGEQAGRKYISMEFIEGQTLKDIVRREDRKMGLDEIAQYGVQIAQAMAYAHSMGIVHRDIKPANIMINADGRVKVTDFGIAKMTETTSQTMTGAVVGTPLYMSPEQIMGRPADARADIYSFGVVLYEMVAGVPPFHDGDLAYMHLHEPPLPLPDDTHPILVEIVEKCLAKDREDRWESFGQIGRLLEDLCDSLGNEGTTVL